MQNLLLLMLFALSGAILGLLWLEFAVQILSQFIVFTVSLAILGLL